MSLDPAALQVLISRLTGIAEEMGEQIDGEESGATVTVG